MSESVADRETVVTEAAVCLEPECTSMTAAPSAWCREHCPVQWRESGLRYSAPPTSTIEHFGGGVDTAKWKNEDGVLHRLDGPAEVHYGEDGRLRSALWCVDGRMHREDGPAEVVVSTWTGSKWHERYHRHGVVHRVDGPAEISFRQEDGSVERVTYVVDGLRHRIDGPAVIEFGPESPGETFCLMDREVDAAAVENYRSAIESGAPVEWALAFALGEGVS